MKKLIIFLFGASLVVSACDNMVEVDDTRSNRFDMAGMDVFTAESENPSGHTKTVLNQDGGIDWQPGDSIHIFKGKSDCGAFVATIEEQAITSDFIGQLDFSEEDKDGAYWAIYPYSKDNTCDGKSVTVHIPAKQVATEGTFDKKAFVSIAHSDKQTLSFYNVCGGVKISVTTPNVKRIVFKGNAGESLAGDAIVTMDENGRPVVQSITNPKTEVTVEAPADKVFEVGKWYYISCLPNSLANGCSVLFRMENDSFSADADYSIDKPIVIKRSIWGRIQNSDDEANLFNVVGGEYTIVYTTNDNNKAEVILDSTYCRSHFYSNGYGFVTLLDSLKQLPNSCFKDCANLSCVMIGGGITTLGEDAFRGCTSLSSIMIPESVTSIGDGAFYGCTGISSITIPEGVTSIGRYAFCGCSSITGITIPEGVTSIGQSAFYGCTGISSITIPESVTSIGDAAFRGCSGLTSITIPEGVTSIGDGAFNRCTGISSITIPESVTSIGNSAFRECSNLTSITIPEGVKSIGDRAFSGCSGLTSITIPDSTVDSVLSWAFLGNYTFENCTSLTSITIPAKVRTGTYTFRGCSGLTAIIIQDGRVGIAEGIFEGCTSLTSITIPESVTSIGNGAFRECSGLTSIIIPDSVQSIGNSAFYGCSGLTSIIINAITAPSLGKQAFDGSKCPIYVFHSYEDYRTAWAEYSSRIVAGIPIDLGLSVKWAYCNLGASKPEEYGNHYAWAETSTKSKYTGGNYKWGPVDYGDGMKLYTKYETKLGGDKKSVLEPEDDAASANLGNGWRMATFEEWTELMENCSWTWTDNYNGTGIGGQIVTSRKTGYTDKSIFLPAAGLFYGSSLTWKGSCGEYWTSTLKGAEGMAYAVYFIPNDKSIALIGRESGLSVRPVCD